VESQEFKLVLEEQTLIQVRTHDEAPCGFQRDFFDNRDKLIMNSVHFGTSRANIRKIIKALFETDNLYPQQCECGKKEIIKRVVVDINISKFLGIEFGRRSMENMLMKIYVNIEFTQGAYKYVLQSFVRKEENHCNTVIRWEGIWLLYNDAHVGLYKPYSRKNIFDLVQYAVYERYEN
jgi:hypothetical protein